jgi:hypothetical protein
VDSQPIAGVAPIDLRRHATCDFDHLGEPLHSGRRMSLSAARRPLELFTA